MELIIELCNRLGYTTPLKALQHHFDEDELEEIFETLVNQHLIDLEDHFVYIGEQEEVN